MKVPEPSSETNNVWPPAPTRQAICQGKGGGGKPKISVLIGVVATGVALSITLGALTNAINSAVSPTYFYLVFNQQVDANEIWKASILEGIKEGGCLGLFVSGVLTAGASAICRSQSSYTLLARYLLGISIGALLAWILGGLMASIFAALRPVPYAGTFGTPGTFNALVRYAWVGGSIWGVEGGSVVATVIALAKLHTRRRSLVDRKYA